MSFLTVLNDNSICRISVCRDGINICETPNKVESDFIFGQKCAGYNIIACEKHLYVISDTNVIVAQFDVITDYYYTVNYEIGVKLQDSQWIYLSRTNGIVFTKIPKKILQINDFIIYNDEILTNGDIIEVDKIVNLVAPQAWIKDNILHYSNAEFDLSI